MTGTSLAHSGPLVKPLVGLLPVAVSFTVWPANVIGTSLGVLPGSGPEVALRQLEGVLAPGVACAAPEPAELAVPLFHEAPTGLAPYVMVLSHGRSMRRLTF